MSNRKSSAALTRGTTGFAGLRGRAMAVAVLGAVVGVALPMVLGRRASAANCSPFATAHVSVSLAPAAIPADGTSHSTATATVSDSFNQPVCGATVVFSTNGDAAVSSTTNKNDGTYTSTITASKTPGAQTVTASTADGHAGSATLHQFGPASALGLTLTPGSIAADGTSTSQAAATVTDAGGNAVVGETVTFTTSGDVKFTAGSCPPAGTATPTADALTDGSGRALACITASQTVDSETITAKVTRDTAGAAVSGPSDTATLTEAIPQRGFQGAQPIIPGPPPGSSWR